MDSKIKDILSDILGDSNNDIDPGSTIVAEIAGEPFSFDSSEKTPSREIVNDSQTLFLKLQEPPSIDDSITKELFTGNVFFQPTPPPIIYFAPPPPPILRPVPPPIIYHAPIPPPTPPVTKDLVDKIKSYDKGDDSAKLNLKNVNPNYKVIITDAKDDFPFLLNSDMLEGVQKATVNISNSSDKARAVYDFIERNVRYGKSRRNVGYRDSEEVMKQKEGVCGEMAYLYVTMARSVGLESNYVSVDVDDRRRNVCHACASVRLNGRTILVDPAYHTYDIRHRKYEILTDKEATSKFRQWRGK